MLINFDELIYVYGITIFNLLYAYFSSNQEINLENILAYILYVYLKLIVTVHLLVSSILLTLLIALLKYKEF